MPVVDLIRVTAEGRVSAPAHSKPEPVGFPHSLDRPITMNYSKTILTFTSITALFIAACGSAALPVDKLTDAKSTVRAAQEAGAQGTPQAALHLKMANDELASAQKAIDDNDGDRARLLLNQAQADADLSLTLARGSAATEAAQVAQAKIVDLSKQAH